MSNEKDKKIALLLEDLGALEGYVNDLFNFSPLPICFISPIGVVLEANPAFEKAFKIKIENIIGESIEEFFEKGEGKKLTRDTLQKKSIEAREISFFPKKKKRVYVQVFSKIRKDEKGRVVGYFLSLFDITKIKEAEEKLKEARDTLEIRVRARTRALEEERSHLEEKVRERTRLLQEKIEDLEKFHKLSVGRELKMIEQKERIRSLEEENKKLREQILKISQTKNG